MVKPASVKSGNVDLTEINRAYLRVWREFGDTREQFAGRYPIQYRQFMARGCLLFVGCNPSFRDTNRVVPRTRTGLAEDMRQDAYYEWEGKLTPEQFQEAEQRNVGFETNEAMCEKDSYFRIIAEVSRRAGFGSLWEHIDLFGVRETKQPEVVRMLRIDNLSRDEERATRGTMSKFAERQVDLAFDVVRLLQPAAIVVINALASNVILTYASGKAMALNLRDDLGTYELQLESRRIPVFFSGMLARQRALDVFSRDRLAWHIKFVQGKIHGRIA